MQILFILNDSPYANERSYNGKRLAKTLAVEGVEVVVFLMADACIARNLCRNYQKATSILSKSWKIFSNLEGS
jgi:sulfur relay (sulfurtransferase) complex TusBCD TusD component (DsrE family)